MENITFLSLLKKRAWITIVKIFLPGLFLLAFLGIFSISSELEFGVFSQDPVQTFHGKPYVGIISNLGVLFWCASATVLFFSFKLASVQNKPEKLTGFFLAAGLLTVFLMIDDLFLVHEVVFPIYLHIDEKVFYLIYGSAVITLLTIYYKIVLNSDYILLLLAFGMFSVSVLFDVLSDLGIEMRYELVVEDSLKFIGVISWFAYFVRLSFRNIKPLILVK